MEELSVGPVLLNGVKKLLSYWVFWGGPVIHLIWPARFFHEKFYENFLKEKYHVLL
jgi:hypothetical protein